MWWVGSLTMMRRSSLCCRGKDASVLIFSLLEELLYSCRLKMVGHSAKEFYRCCLLQVSANVEADFYGSRGVGEFAESSLVCPGLVS